MGLAAETVTVAVDSASSVSSRSTAAVERMLAVRLDLLHVGRQADPIEDIDEGLRIEFLDIHHRLRIPDPGATSMAAATGGTPAV